MISIHDAERLQELFRPRWEGCEANQIRRRLKREETRTAWEALTAYYLDTVDHHAVEESRRGNWHVNTVSLRGEQLDRF